MAVDVDHEGQKAARRCPLRRPRREMSSSRSAASPERRRRRAAVKAEENIQTTKLAPFAPKKIPPPPERSDEPCYFFTLLPEELQLCCLRHLVYDGRFISAGARNMLAFASTSSAARECVERHSQPLWSALLEHSGIEVDESAMREDLDLRAVCRRLRRPPRNDEAMQIAWQFEAQGLSPDATDANEGEQRAWWRCYAQAIRVQDSILQVRVRFHGYDESDEEWRPLEQLRPYRVAKHGHVFWEQLKPGNECEVSYQLTGHPAARWEAVIVTLARKHEGRRGAIRATVHYYGFAEAWDETLHDPSLRLQPSRKAERFAQAAVWRHNNGAASSSSTNGAASSSSASL